MIPLRPRHMASAALLAWAGCVPASALPDGDRLPYRFHLVSQTGSAVFVDLDSDGQDETLLPETRGADEGSGLVTLIAPDGSVLDQYRLDGRVLPPHAVDTDGDGFPEVLMPFVRQDSLFLTVGDRAGNKLYGFFLTAGAPRIEPDGRLPWDPSVRHIEAVDLHPSPGPELVTVVSTGLARHPRGLMVHTLPDGREVDSWFAGAALSYPVESPAGEPDWVFLTNSTDNGADAGGFSDRAGYAIRVGARPSLGPRWSRRLGGQRTAVGGGRIDTDGDGTEELVAVVLENGEGRVEILDGATGALRTTVPAPPLGQSVLLPPSAGGTDPVRVLGRTSVGELQVIGLDGRTLRRTEPGINYGFPHRVGDLTGDERQDFLANAGGGVALLDPDLRIRAFVPGHRLELHQDVVRRRARPAPPQLLIREADAAGPYHLYEVRPNRAYLWTVSAPFLLPGGSLAALALFLAGLTRARTRALRANAAADLLLDEDRGFAALVTGRGRISWGSGSLRRMFGPARHLSDLPPEIASAIGAWMRDEESPDGPPEPGSVRVADGPGQGAWELRGRRTSTGPRGEWWIAGTRGGAVSERDVWALTARQISHDFKGPLNRVQGRLDHMQLDYADADPALVRLLDRHGVGIRQQIRRLTRRTDNFLKYVDVVDPARSLIELNEIVHETMHSFEPAGAHGIELALETSPDDLEVLADRDQLHSVVENLVQNAVDAIGERGRITVATRMARGLRTEDHAAGRDHVVLEVRDTGRGMPAEVRARAFEAGFSTEAGGSGLGLAIVKKIVSDHGGWIDVDSEPGVGTTFTVTLPAA